MGNLQVKNVRAHEDSVINTALQILERRMREAGDILDKLPLAVKFFRLRLGEKKTEVFSCAFLDNQSRVIAVDDVFLGTINSTGVYPREVVRRVVEYNATAVIVAHNHVSGVCEPSSTDCRITIRLMEVLAMIDVPILDHIVVSATDYFSFKEQGFFKLY